MAFQEFKQKILNHYEARLPFVIYRKPKAEKVFSLLQKDNKLYVNNDLSETGFVFAPFDTNQNIILIPDHNSFSLDINFNEEFKKNFTDYTHTNITNQLSKPGHIKLVEKGIQAIQQGDLHKVVLSRKEKVEDIAEKDSIDIYERLLACYPNAFVYLWFHPKVGMWAGATPETLMHLVDNKIRTMSLAGTQSFKEGEIIWGAKEKEEQQFVTDFIIDSLQDFLDAIQVSEPYTHKAGKIVHIRSDIEATLKENVKLKDLVSKLHPTPAVCGLPKESSKGFILQNENYNRKYYTGFLGRLKLNSSKIQADFFVNLRCMEFKKDSINIYVGGGITKDSNPEKEWDETVKKSETMKSVLI